MNDLLEIEHLPVSELVPRESNPRRHSKKQIKQIAESIKTFGFKVPVLIDGRNRLICGHGRLAACQLLGIEKVPVIRAGDLDEAKIQAFMIADNRLTEISEWNDELLGANFQFLTEAEVDFDLEITGFEYGDIEALLAESEPSSSSQEPPVPDASDLTPIVELGDIWQLGKHRIVCGDSLSSVTYDALFSEGGKAAIVFTDPPYNMSARDIGQTCEKEHGNFAMGSGEMSQEEFTAFLESVFRELKRCSESGSIHYVCMDWRHSTEILEAGMRVYDDLKNLCVWTKSNAGMGTFYRSQHELVFVFKSGREKHQNHFKLGQHGRYRSNVWEYPSIVNQRVGDGEKGGKEALELHPTIKPVALIADALRDCSRRNEIVLDAFLGSGSTLIAAEMTQRVCYGIELSPRYVDVAITRWQELTGQDAVHAEYGCTYDEFQLVL